MSRRGIVHVGVALEPARAFGLPAPESTTIVENHAFWPSVTVAGETGPGSWRPSRRPPAVALM